MENEEPSQGIVTSGRTAFEARMRSVVVDGARIAYVDEGEGEPILWGEEDPFVPRETPRQLADGIPGAVLTMIPGAGHFVAEECPEEFGRALGKLLERAPRHATPSASSCHGRRFTAPVEGARS